MSATSVTIGATAPSGYQSTTFVAGNTASGPGVWTFVGGAITSNTTGAAVCLDPLTTTAFFACAKAGSVITANFAGGITGLDLLWGSPDGYNTLSFHTGLNGTGASESFVPGTPPLVTPAPVAKSPVLFVADAGVVWQSVTFTSTFDAFEFGDVATLNATAAPEPSSALLLGAGVLAIGVGAMLRRKPA